MSHFDYSGSTVIVTGAASGLGKQTALRFAAAGANVVLADISTPAGEELAHAIAATGGKAIFVRTDVAVSSDVERLVKTAVTTYGQLHFAFNNAGIAPGGPPIDQVSEEDWDRTLGINLKGVWLCLKHEAAAMRGRGGGSIVNTSSIMGVVSGPGLAAYSASKTGVIGLTKAAAIDLAGEGIRVNALCPGGIGQTAITENPANLAAMEQLRRATPMQRLGTPDHIAETVLWLCSPGAAYMTGQAITVDGGYTLW